VTNDAILVNGQIKVHPAKIDNLKAAGVFEQFLNVTKALQDGTPLSQEDKALLRDHRLRMESQLTTAQQSLDQVLASARLTDDEQARVLFGNMTDRELGRLVEMKSETDQFRAWHSTLPEEAAQYALSQNPSNVREFVAYYQMYGQTFDWQYKAANDSYKNRTQELMASQGLKLDAAQKQASRELFGVEFVGEGKKLKAEARAQAARKMAPELATTAYAEKQEQLAGRVGGNDVGQLPDAELIDAIKQIDAQFGSEQDAIYHAHKHFGEVPESEANRGSGEMDSYLLSAQETVRNPTEQPVVRVNQNGSRSVMFVRKVDGASMRAIVFVSRDGHALLATYGKE